MRRTQSRASKDQGALIIGERNNARSTVIDTHGLVVPPDAPPGEYALAVAVHALDPPHERLPVSGDGTMADGLLPLATLAVR